MDSMINLPETEQIKPVKKGISGSTLKLVAIGTMLIDHTAASVLERILYSGNNYSNTLNIIYVIMREIGRLAFPIFCFLLVEGIVHTHNKWKYAMRLAAFALISEIPFDLAFYGKPFFFGNQNVFFTLLIGLFVMIGFGMVRDVWSGKKWIPVIAVAGVALTGYLSIDIVSHVINFINSFLSGFGSSLFIKMNKEEYVILAVVSAVILLIVYLFMSREKSLQTAGTMFADLAILIIGMKLADFMSTDYSSFGVLTIAIIYALRRNYKNSMFGGCLTLTIMSLGEATSFFDLILVKFYNGKRGLNLKYLFYCFYPVHLFLLYLICYFMKLV